MVYNVIMETSPDKIKELVKEHYEIGNSESVMDVYNKCGLQVLMQTFAIEIMSNHIIQYSTQFPQLTDEFQNQFLEEVAEIISSNMDMGDNDPIINEIENYNSWAEMDVDNFMSELENFVKTPVPDPPSFDTHADRIDAEPSIVTPDDNLDSVWKSEADQVWDCDDKSEPEKKETKDPEPVKWDGGW